MWRSRRGALIAALLIAVSGSLAACSGDSEPADAGGEADGAPSTTDGGAGSASSSVEVGELDPACDPLDSRHCLLPFPSDAFTVADPQAPTGMRVSFAPSAMPTNADGVAIDPTDWNVADGFSPGAMSLVHLPGADLERSGAPVVTDLGRSLDADSPSVLLDATTGERVPHWVEYDANAGSQDTSLLILRPARALAEGHRHVVAFRDLVDASGSPLGAGDVFAAYRDEIPTDSAVVEARRDAMRAVFADLADAGVAREDLIVAWDFTVASQESLSARLLAARDDAFASLGDQAPTFRVDSVTDDGAAREVVGTLVVPGYLDGDGGPGSRLTLDPEGLPVRSSDHEARYVCTLPTAGPAPVSLYGHGLLGSADEVLGIGAVAAAAGRALCATDWIGMSRDDVPTVVETLAELSGFATLPDRLTQAHLDFLFLGRALVHPAGFASDPAFQAADGRPLVDGERLSFIGASEGGILGGATSAVATDWDRVALVVGGANYSTMLRRSIDFDPFAEVFEPAYPDEVERTLAIALVQMLWDRGEVNGYSQHLVADPLPGIEPKTVLLFEAFGDHQVANVATDTLARTLGLAVHRPSVAPDRSPDAEPQWGLDAIEAYPYTENALVVWDYGAPAPPTTNTPPRDGDDPHGAAGSDPAALALVVGFLDGSIAQPCGGAACATPALVSTGA